MLIAVDTGATKTLVAGLSKSGEIQSSQKFPTPKDVDSYKSTLEETIASVSDSQAIDGIVVALPGRVDKKGVLASARNLGWQAVDLAPKLKTRFKVPVLVENDANLAGLAEARSLNKPVDVCLYITVSTGIGTGIITNNEIDKNFSQSEGGQVIVTHKGRMRRWEDFASGSALYHTYHTYARDITSKRIWKRVAKNISKGLLVLLPPLRPDVVIIGGSIGTYFDRYSRDLTDELHKHLHYVPPIVEAKHPEQAVIYGCYYYALSHLAIK